MTQLLEKKNASVDGAMQLDAVGLDQMIAGLAGMTMLRRAPSLSFVAETAAFLASDGAGAITGTITNATCGLIPV